MPTKTMRYHYHPILLTPFMDDFGNQVISFNLELDVFQSRQYFFRGE